MNIVFVCNELPPAPSGGIGHAVNLMAPAMASLGHCVRVVGAYEAEYDWQLPGVEVMAVRPCPSIARHLMQRRFLRRFASRRWIEQLCHNETCAALRQGILSGRRSRDGLLVEWPSYQGHCNWSAPGVCHVVRLQGTTFMSTYEDDPAASRYQTNERATLMRARNWIGVSEWSIEECRRATGVDPERRTVIFNPVECNVFQPSSDSRDELVVVYAGTLCERKGDDRLALAANSFLRRFPSARLLYVGRHSQQRAEFIFSLVEEDLRERVSIQDNATQAALAAALRRAALFAMPSRGETFGMVYAEAMASGIPVVGGDTTGIPEVVPHGKAGLLVDVDDVRAISEAVEKLLASESLRRSMGSYGREVAVERYSLATCVRDTLAFYSSCFGEAGDRVV